MLLKVYCSESTLHIQYLWCGKARSHLIMTHHSPQAFCNVHSDRLIQFCDLFLCSQKLSWQSIWHCGAKSIFYTIGCFFRQGTAGSWPKLLLPQSELQDRLALHNLFYGKVARGLLCVCVVNHLYACFDGIAVFKKLNGINISWWVSNDSHRNHILNMIRLEIHCFQAHGLSCQPFNLDRNVVMCHKLEAKSLNLNQPKL